MKDNIVALIWGSVCIALVLAASLLALAAAEGAVEEVSGSLTHDFDAAVARLQLTRSNISKTPGHEIAPELRLGLDRYVAEAEKLAKTHGQAATNFLQTIIMEPAHPRRSIPRELALVTLAVLADHDSAARTLTRYVIDGGFHDQTALIAVTYAPPAVARSLGREALEASSHSYRALAAAGALLRLFGEPADAEGLRQAIAAPPISQTNIEAGIRSTASSDLVAMQQRHRRPPSERAAWAEQDRAVWRAIHSQWPDYHAKESNLRYVHRGLLAHGRLRTDYLKDRLGASPITLDEFRLIIWTVKEQRETTLNPELGEVIAGQHDGWTGALETLLSFGTPDALETIKRLIPPPARQVRDAAAKAEADRRARIVDYLTKSMSVSHGKVLLLTELSADPAYTTQERAVFAIARKNSQVRMELLSRPTGSNSIMGGGPAPPDR